LCKGEEIVFSELENLHFGSDLRDLHFPFFLSKRFREGRIFQFLFQEYLDAS
jgi:hypothetical protein